MAVREEGPEALLRRVGHDLARLRSLALPKADGLPPVRTEALNLMVRHDIKHHLMVRHYINTI